MIKVTVIGGGNVAYHLTKNLLDNKFVKVVQVYNRNIEKIQYLEGKTLITDSLINLKEAAIYIISVSDKAVADVSSKLRLKNKLVVHTSGSIAMRDLKSDANKGVFYLLQSFSKKRELNFSTIPICIEAERKSDLKLLETLAKSISKSVYHVDSKQRKNLHIAAVFVNNFANHLYTIGSEICEENNISFKILQPLIEETAKKIADLHPLKAQTGPAKRSDTDTIEKHIIRLTNNQQEIYKLLTKSISKTYDKKL
ncbi:MAG: DUF2520 domain-containing protein [Flavobacteriaceae bacterium]|nr:DUF2520 domain-containing protein [Flavobacteriaceae bacterium]